MGDLATRAVMGKAHAITKCRGTVLNNSVYPIFSAGYVFRSLEQEPTFRSDIATLKKLSENEFDINQIQEDHKNYQYVTDISFLLTNRPKLIAVDTETTGLDVIAPDFKVLVVQIAYDDNNVALCPLHENFWPKDGTYTEEERTKLFLQLKELLEDQSIKKVGHNLNYDISALEVEGIKLKGVLGDTQLLAWFLDENMFSKTLDDVVRRWLPSMAGYNDLWNSTIDKSNMLNLDSEVMLQYGGGDAYVSRKVFLNMWEELKQNPHQMNLFIKLKMPGLLAFRQMEQTGIYVDVGVLNELKLTVKEDLDRLEKELIDLVPKAVIRKHMDKGLKFTRDAFVRDILFSPEGFNLQPVVFTKSTAKNEKEEERLPSVSAKDHLPFFLDEAGKAGDFVHNFIEFKKLSKLYSTYVKEFHSKYVKRDGRIHSQFVLHITTTGRTSSRGPNAQNFPSRGKWAKPYKKTFVAGHGYKFVSADLSQIELRLIAWESGDPVMLDAYRTGKDIHKITAMAVSGHTDESWSRLSKEDQKLLRYRAKAVNFGFCYGMGPRKFRRYAKTDYGLELTEREAQQYYDTYHSLYRKIKSWHSKRIVEVNRYGQVISLHGSVRHLPSARSNDRMVKAQAERQAINTPIQCFGSDLGVVAIARIARQCDPEIITPVAFIHDDIILQVKDGHEEEAVNMLLWVLNNPPLESMFKLKPPIPIIAEPDVGLSLGNMYELYDLGDDAPTWVKQIRVNPQKPTFWNDERDLV